MSRCWYEKTMDEELDSQNMQGHFRQSSTKISPLPEDECHLSCVMQASSGRHCWDPHFVDQRWICIGEMKRLINYGKKKKINRQGRVEAIKKTSSAAQPTSYSLFGSDAAAKYRMQISGQKLCHRQCRCIVLSLVLVSRRWFSLRILPLFVLGWAGWPLTI